MTDYEVNRVIQAIEDETNRISAPFQDSFNFGVGSCEVTQYVLNVQPVIPVTWSL